MDYILLFGMPGGPEILFIILVVVMLFGSKKIPELARGLGKGMREIKNATGDIQREIREGAKDLDVVKDSLDVKKKVKDYLNEANMDKQPVASGSNKNEEPKDSKEEANIKDPEISQHQTIQRRGPYEKGDVQKEEEE